MRMYSIIIPVYNAEKYLHSCMECILTQNSEFDYEIILVNDGSKDQSPQICDSYAQRFPNVKVIHQVNQGVSAARNAGIAASSGTYLLFLDSDDCWDASFLGILDQQVSQKPDLIEFGFRIFSDDHIQEPILPAVETAGMTGLAYIEAHKDKNCMPIVSCWAAAFRREFLDQENLRFPLGVAYGEDMEFHMYAMKAAKTVLTILKPLYLYRVNEMSAVHTITIKKMRDMLSACVKIYRLFPCALFANYYCMNLLGLNRLDRQDARQLNDFLSENRDILRSVSGMKQRIACVLFKVFGWYEASRLVQMWVRTRNKKKG